MSMVEGIRTAIAKAMVGQPGVLITNDALDLGARAAIEAMREPTAEMIDAGTAADWVGACEDRTGLSIMPYTEMVPDDDAEEYVLIERTLPGIWPSMIDAALRDA